MISSSQIGAPFYRRLGVFLLAGVVVGAVAGLAVAMTYPKQTAIVYMQIGLVPDQAPSAMGTEEAFRGSDAAEVWPPEPLAQANVALIEPLKDTIARLYSPRLAEAVAKRVNDQGLAAGFADTLKVRSIPTVEGGLIELAYSSPMANTGGIVLNAIAQQLIGEHSPLFVAAAAPYTEHATELARDLLEKKRILEQMKGAAAAETDPKMATLLRVGQYAAQDLVEESEMENAKYRHRLSLVGVSNTHIEGKPLVRRSILSNLAAAAVLGSLGGLVLAALSCVAFGRPGKP